MRQITVIDGHPDPSPGRLNHALADRYALAARAAGSEVRRIDICDLDIPLLRDAAKFYNEPAPQGLRDAQRDIAWADHLVFFYPLWHGTMPAFLKAFVEQVFRPGFAMEYGGKNRFPKQLFKGKSARVVVTMGMPALIYRTYFGDYGVKSFERSTLALCGVGPIDETLLGGVGGESLVRGARWLDLMDKLAEDDASPQRRRRRVLARRVARAALLLLASYAAYIAASSAGKTWLRSDTSAQREPAPSIAEQEELLTPERA